MRVGFVIYGSLDLVSGGFLYDRQVVAGLRARGVEVEVVALPWRRWPWSLASNLRRPRGAWDVVVEDELVHPSVFARRPAIPAVALVHNLGHPGPGARAAIERRYLSRVAGVVAVCRQTLADVEALVGRAVPAVVARAGRDHLAPAAIDVEGRAHQGELRILTIGTVMAHKGLHRLLAALAPLSGWSLDVAGSLVADRAYVDVIRREVARRGWGERVRLHGEVGRPELEALLARAHLFALPSDREAYSLACLEALGFGLPVLVTDRGGMREMIDGENGFLLAPDDTAAWTAAIGLLAENRSALAARGRMAQARFAEHGTWAETAAVIEPFLRAVITKG
jgi:glycosyltransferase involved in cell wall biosynthesis